MPRFAANLSMMFTEVPFIERFAAARKAGFDAVEFLFPYDYSTLQIQKQLEQKPSDTGAVQYRSRRY